MTITVRATSIGDAWNKAREKCGVHVVLVYQGLDKWGEYVFLKNGEWRGEP